MSLNLGRIPHPPHAKPEKLAIQGLGNGLSNRGLSHARGTDEAEDFALDGATEFADGDKFLDSVFDVREAIVVFIEDGCCAGDVEVFGGAFAPWHAG